jgi:hypothetical protein
MPVLYNQQKEKTMVIFFEKEVALGPKAHYNQIIERR